MWEIVGDPRICNSLKRWRPRRDLNPCYRRERAAAYWITLYLQGTGRSVRHCKEWLERNQCVSSVYFLIAALPGLLRSIRQPAGRQLRVTQGLAPKTYSCFQATEENVTAIPAEGSTLLIDAGVAIIAGWHPICLPADLHRAFSGLPVRVLPHLHRDLRVPWPITARHGGSPPRRGSSLHSRYY